MKAPFGLILARKQVREAVEFKRTRLWDNQPPAKEADTGLGREEAA
jgi:hypothetical protein